MSGGMRGSMMEARHGVMLLGDEFGVHLPRALSTFLAGLGPIGVAMQAAFPFLAIGGLAAIFVNHLRQAREEGEALTQSEATFGVTVNGVFQDLNDRLLQAGMKADELRGDHLAALHKELQLIDHATMKDLAKEFGVLDKAAEAVFAHLKQSWYEIGTGSVGAQHALSEFKATYDLLLAEGKDTDAQDLLKGTLGSAEAALKKMRAARAEAEQATTPEEMAGGPSEKELQAQETLVEILSKQVQVKQDLAALSSAEKANATTVADNKMDSQAAKAEAQYAHIKEIVAKGHQELTAELEKDAADSRRILDYRLSTEFAAEVKAAEERARIGEELGRENARHAAEMGKLGMESDIEQGKIAVTNKRSQAEQMLAVSLAAEQKEYEIKRQAFETEIASLDKNGKDYELHLKQIQNKEEELTRAHENKITQIEDQAAKERQRKQQEALQRMENGFAQSGLRILMGQQTVANMLRSIGEQVASATIEAAIAEKAGLESTKMDEAKAAARKMYLAGTKFPWPTNIVMAPALGALGFAAMMAFEEGGIVPGVEKGDVVPARLTPGEGVIPKQLMENLTNAARSGNVNGGGDVHMHHHAVYNVQAFDSTGVDKVLRQHGEKFSRHFERELRRRNL